MRIAVYVPLLLSLLAPLGARPLAERCEPRLSTWLLTASSLVLGAASTISLGLLAVTGLLRVPPLAGLGHWSASGARSADPAELSVALVAGLLLGGALLTAARLLRRRAGTLAAAALDAACMPARDGLVVVADAAADAYALPGLPGRVVVSTGMLDALPESEHEILLAHERAHLAAHHYAFVALAQLGAAANPLLRPFATAVTYTIERWADESAAAGTGDRKRVARAVGRAALAAHHRPARARVTDAALGILGRDPERPGSVRPGSVRPGPERLGPERLGPVRLGVFGRIAALRPAALGPAALRLGSLRLDALRPRVPRLGGLRRRRPLAKAGPVPRRVAALLAPPPARHPVLTAVTAAVLAVATLTTAEAAHDLHVLLESVGAW